MESREKPFFWRSLEINVGAFQVKPKKWKQNEKFSRVFTSFSSFALLCRKLRKRLGTVQKFWHEFKLLWSFWFICWVAAETAEIFRLLHRPDEFAFSLFIEAISPSKEFTLKIKNRLFSFLIFPDDLKGPKKTENGRKKSRKLVQARKSIPRRLFIRMSLKSINFPSTSIPTIKASYKSQHISWSRLRDWSDKTKTRRWKLFCFIS